MNNNFNFLNIFLNKWNNFQNIWYSYYNSIFYELSNPSIRILILFKKLEYISKNNASNNAGFGWKWILVYEKWVYF